MVRQIEKYGLIIEQWTNAIIYLNTSRYTLTDPGTRKILTLGQTEPSSYLPSS